MVKAADSPWRCNDRGLSWLKIKADYVHNVEIDAVIIGARYGTGRRAGGVAEYLLALAEAPHGGAAEPSTFISFCMYACLLALSYIVPALHTGCTHGPMQPHTP